MPQPSVHSLWGSFALDRHSGVSLQDQIAHFFRSAIAEGRVRAGRRVSSSRQLASDFGVSRNTAVEAYERLVAEGYLVTRPGAGIFIAELPPEKFSLKAYGLAPRAAAHPDLTRLDMRNYLLPLAPGMPAIDKFPWTTWARLTSQICRERPLNAVGYGDPQGELALRQTIAEYLATSRGILCDASQILVMAGSVQSLEFMVAQVATAGDSAWVEEPSGMYMRTTVRGAGLVPVSIDVDQHGMDVALGMRKAPAARLAIVSPTHQYPTGATMSLERRQMLVDWSEDSDAWILENEIDGDYRYTPHPLTPIYTMSRKQRVFYCGSLSKPLAPGLRTNYLVVPASLMGNLSLTTTLVPMLTQLVLARFNAAGYLALHMRRMRTLYARRRNLLLDALRTQAADFMSVPNVPEGGLRVIAALRHDIDDVQLSRKCLEAGIKVDPLSICYAGAKRSGLIIGFASTPEDRIPSAVATLASVFLRELDS
jgi:GntR family transcriptional regulator/MocR family aminotransferase